MTPPSASAIAWLPPGREARVGGLPLRPPLRAFRSALGLLVAGELAGEEVLPRLLASGARVFVALEEGAWVEVAARGRMPALAPPAPGAAHLACAGGAVWSVPSPGGWPPLAQSLSVVWPAVEVSGPPLPRVRVRLGAAAPGLPSSRDGILCRAGEGGSVAAYLAALPALALRDLRRGEAGGWWWLHAARGLGREFPRVGRPLRNLGTPVEPVLVPADREPAPRLLAVELRRLFSAGEGEGVIWWDEAGGEAHAVFLRSALVVLTREAVAGRAW
jgi:hypothetical protein